MPKKIFIVDDDSEQPIVKDIPVVILSAVNIRFKLGFSKKEIDENWMKVLS